MTSASSLLSFGLASAPAALVLALVAWVHRPGVSGPLRRAAFELRLLRLPALVLWGAPPLLAWAQPSLGGAALAVAAPLLVAAGLGAELEEGRLAAWLAQPLSRARLRAEKLGVSGLLVLGAVLQGWVLHPGRTQEVATVAAVLALGLVPLLALAARHAVFAGLATAGGAWGLHALVEAGMGAGAPGARLLVACALAAGVSGVALRACPGRMAALRARPPAAAGQGRLPGGTSWRGPALRVWLRKELRLQASTGRVAGLLVAVWGGAMALPGTRPVVFELLGFSGLALGLLAGVAPLAVERRLGTTQLDLLALPQAVAWRARVGVALATALACGVALPLLLAALSQGLSRVLGGPGLLPASPMGPLTWAAAVLACAPVGLAASARVDGYSRAFLAACGAVVGLAVWAGAAVVSGGWLVQSLVARQALALAVAGQHPAAARAASVPVLSGLQAKVLVLLVVLGLLGTVAAVALRWARRALLPASSRALRPVPALVSVGVAGFVVGGVAVGALALSGG